MKHIIISVTLGLALALALLLLLPSSVLTGRAANEIIYVDCDAEGANTGNNWTDAYTSLQTALDNANYGTQVWVATGIYTPTKGVTRTATFQLKSGIEIYGGFTGGDIYEDMDDRDWENNLTILSGDLGGDDITDPDGVLTNTHNVRGDNAYHVVSSSGMTNTVLDGFIITAGDANVDGSTTERGGGMYNTENSILTLNNIIFSGNYAYRYGGGLANYHSDLELTNVTFSNNYTIHEGGGMYDWYSSSTLINVIFSNNYAILTGGGINSTLSDAALTNVIFDHNGTNWSGGGMSTYVNNATLVNVTFNSNYSTYGNGGGMHNNSATQTLTNVTFSGNQAKTSDLFGSEGNGGGMFNNNNALNLTNVIFSNNRARNIGGGIYNNGSNPILTNVTFSGNQADNMGGGIYNNNSNPTLVNCILWYDNAPDEPEIYNEGSSSPDISYSNIQNGPEENHNIHEEPKFVDPIPASESPTIEGDYRLNFDSPSIDVGNNDAPNLAGVTIDLDGKQRIVDGKRDGTATVDMGAYEFLSPIYVDHAALGPEHDGFSWTRAFTNVQKALSIANPGDEIWVAEGIYYPDEGEGQTNNDPYSTFLLMNDVAIYGGFAGGDDDEDMNDRDWENNHTVLSGDLQDDDATDIITNTDDINGTNAYHVVSGGNFTAESARLDGFIVTAGKSNIDGGGMHNNGYSSPTVANVIFSGNYAESNGGGMFNTLLSRPIVIDVTFSGNYAENGGGMYSSTSAPSLTNVTFSDNSADYGGGMYNYASGLSTLTQVTFNDNHATTNGGGMVNSGGGLTIINTTFRSNQADNNGGAVFNEYSSPTFVNALFSDNQATNGGGMYNNIGENELILINTTFSGNQAITNGSAIYNDASDPAIANSIIWGNQTGGDVQEIHNANGSSPTFNYSDLSHEHAGMGNLSQNPQFINPSEGDYHLSPNSPVVDRGNNASLTETIATISTDLDGHPRFVDGDPNIEGAVVDMGAYELPQVASLIVNLAGSGLGSVSSAPSGINCPGNCSFNYPTGSIITLTATPGITSTFAGWSDTCTSIDGDTCLITLDMDQTVTATFSTTLASLDVNLAGSGLGSVSSTPEGISCPDNCSFSYPIGSAITLTATPGITSTFAGWSDACTSIDDDTCLITLDTDQTVTATFSTTLASLDVNLAGSGLGSVSSTPEGISCPGDCTHDYPISSAVTLTATASDTSTFAGWHGACVGDNPTCQIILNTNQIVTATFSYVATSENKIYLPLIVR